MVAFSEGKYSSELCVADHSLSALTMFSVTLQMTDERKIRPEVIFYDDVIY